MGDNGWGVGRRTIFVEAQPLGTLARSRLSLNQEETVRADQSAIGRARMNLTDFVYTAAKAAAERVGFGWTPEPDAPSTYECLREAFDRSSRSGVDLPVSSLYCEGTIFAGPSANHAMRFWHDTNHVELDRGFEVDDEYEVAEFQLEVTRRAGFGHRTLEYRLMHADSIGQTYCLAVLGRFPHDQIRFAIWCVEDGLDEAVAYEYAKGGGASSAAQNF